LRPTDFSEWSSSFTIRVSIVSNEEGAQEQVVILETDVLSHVFTGLSAGLAYLCTVSYINDFGEGIREGTGFGTPSRIPDAPILYTVVEGDQEATIHWQAPEFDGQSTILEYKVYKDGVSVFRPDSETREYTFTGLTNGQTYSFEVSAINAVGESAKSSALQTVPFGAMTISSVVVSQKTITLTVNPNGKVVTRALFLAIDSDPNTVSDGSFIMDIPQIEISQSLTAPVVITRTYSSFTSNIQFWCVMAYREDTCLFEKSQA
jgi:predicted phage tail protein